MSSSSSVVLKNLSLVAFVARKHGLPRLRGTGAFGDRLKRMAGMTDDVQY